MSPSHRNEPRRHHYVPRFLLQRFTDSAAQQRSLVQQLELASGRCRRISPRDAAVVRDFYSLLDEEGNRHHDAERALARIEDLAAPLIERLASPGGRVEGEDRYNLAVFLAMLWLRTPLWRERFRHTEEQFAEFFARHAPAEHYQAAARAAGEELTLEQAAAQRDGVIAALDRGGIEIDAPPERHVALLFQHAASTAWIVFRLDWSVVRAPETAAYVIADEPVTVYEVEGARASRPSAPLASLSAEMVVPLDPRLALALTPNSELLADVARDNGRGLREMTGEQVAEQIDRPVAFEDVTATGERIADMNFRSYAHAQRWLYGQTQGVLTDLWHLARGTQRHRLPQLRPRDPDLVILNQVPGEAEWVWRMSERPQQPARPQDAAAGRADDSCARALEGRSWSRAGSRRAVRSSTRAQLDCRGLRPATRDRARLSTE